MRNKKILAIVTLVAFMISILPMAAFAAPGDTASGYTSIVDIETESAPAASANDYVEIEIEAKDINYNKAAGNIYVATSRPTVDQIYGDSGWALPSSTAGVKIALDGNGEAVVKIKSNVIGTSNVVIGTDAGKVLEYAVKTEGVSALAAGALQHEGSYYIPVEFTSPKASGLTLSIKEGNNAYANGLAYVTLKAELKSGNVPVVDKEVDFEVLPSGATLSASKVTTNSSGVAEVKVFATKSGKYTVTAKAADVTDATQDVDFISTGVVDVKAESDSDQKVARETSGQFELKFSFYDAAGNKVNIPAAISNAAYSSDAFTAAAGIQGAELRMVTRPSGVAIKEKPVVGTDFDLDEDDGNLVIALNKSKLNKDGDYEIRLTLVNGKTISYSFNVKEQGDVTEMKISYKSSSYASDANVPAAKIELLDAEGYKTEITSGVTFSNNNPKLVNGVFNSSTGAFKASDDNYGILTVTAVHNSKNLVASTNVGIEKAAAYLKLTAPNYTAIGDEASVAIQLVDIDGKPVSGGAVGAITSRVVVTKPEGAVVGTSVSTGDFDKGVATLKVNSNKAGNVGVQVMITVDGKTYTGATTVPFGEAAIAQKSLVMFIGATQYMLGGAPAVTDAAPFIENGRTFVAVRPIGDALGMTIYWDAETQTVTMTKPGETVTIIVGASSFKVDRAGVVTEYPTDAPAQIKDGRTYLPFRAIGEAMGYAVNFDAETQSVTFM